MLDVRTLTDGGQTPVEVAEQIATFVGGARSTLDFAHYDFHLDGDTAAVVGDAIKAAAARGVAVRFLYNLDHRNPIPVPPPPEPDGELIASLEVPVRAVAGVPDLMHHKYVVRDGESVWTGSTNWTEDSWSRQENVIVLAESRELAARFTENFDELWDTGVVERSGFVAPRPGRCRDAPGATVVHAGKRRGSVAPDREGNRTGAPARAHRLAGDHGGTGALDARGEDLRRRAGHRRLRRPAPGSRRHLPVAAERQRLVEAAAARARYAGAVLRASRRHPGARERCTTSCTRRSRSPTTPSSRAASTCRGRASSTRRTCSSSRTPELADRLAGYIDEVRARYPAFAVKERVTPTSPSEPPPPAPSGAA